MPVAFKASYTTWRGTILSSRPTLGGLHSDRGFSVTSPLGKDKSIVKQNALGNNSLQLRAAAAASGRMAPVRCRLPTL